MTFRLISTDGETLNGAVACVGEAYPELVGKKDERCNAVSFRVSLGEEEGIAFLEKLLNQFPKLDAGMECTSDVEGRDSSWWSLARYASVTDTDGSRHMELESGGTYWQ